MTTEWRARSILCSYPLRVGRLRGEAAGERRGGEGREERREHNGGAAFPSLSSRWPPSFLPVHRLCPFLPSLRVHHSVVGCSCKGRISRFMFFSERGNGTTQTLGDGHISPDLISLQNNKGDGQCCQLDLHPLSLFLVRLQHHASSIATPSPGPWPYTHSLSFRHV